MPQIDNDLQRTVEPYTADNHTKVAEDGWTDQPGKMPQVEGGLL